MAYSKLAEERRAYIRELLRLPEVANQKSIAGQARVLLEKLKGTEFDKVGYYAIYVDVQSLKRHKARRSKPVIPPRNSVTSDSPKLEADMERVVWEGEIYQTPIDDELPKWRGVPVMGTVSVSVGLGPPVLWVYVKQNMDSYTNPGEIALMVR